MIANITWYRRRLMTPANILFCWHLWLTLALAWWAFILVLPVPTFAISQSYSSFVRISPDEDFWAFGYGFASLCGAFGCWASWPPRLRRDTFRQQAIRMTAAVVLAIVHGITAVLMFQGAKGGTGPGIYVLIMCSAYLLLRAEYERS